MTNYNERLDKLLSYKVLGIRVAYETQDREEALADLHQAITLLIKELVAEAKPEKRELIEPVTGEPVSSGDRVTVDVEADPRGSLIFVQNNGYNMALNQFEQNLLKALEEISYDTDR